MVNQVNGQAMADFDGGDIMGGIRVDYGTGFVVAQHNLISSDAIFSVPISNSSGTSHAAIIFVDAAPDYWTWAVNTTDEFFQTNEAFDSVPHVFSAEESTFRIDTVVQPIDLGPIAAGTDTATGAVLDQDSDALVDPLPPLVGPIRRPGRRCSQRVDPWTACAWAPTTPGAVYSRPGCQGSPGKSRSEFGHL